MRPAQRRQAACRAWDACSEARARVAALRFCAAPQARSALTLACVIWQHGRRRARWLPAAAAGSCARLSPPGCVGRRARGCARRLTSSGSRCAGLAVVQQAAQLRQQPQRHLERPGVALDATDTRKCRAVIEIIAFKAGKASYLTDGCQLPGGAEPVALQPRDLHNTKSAKAQTGNPRQDVWSLNACCCAHQCSLVYARTPPETAAAGLHRVLEVCGLADVVLRSRRFEACCCDADAAMRLPQAGAKAWHTEGTVQWELRCEFCCGAGSTPPVHLFTCENTPKHHPAHQPLQALTRVACTKPLQLTHIAANSKWQKVVHFYGCCIADSRVGPGRDACTATCYIERPVTSGSCTLTKPSTSAGYRNAEPTTSTVTGSKGQCCGAPSWSSFLLSP